MPNFDKQQRDFLKGPGNKENFNETNFSGYDQANIAASPTMGLNKIPVLPKLNEGGQKLDAMDGNADGKIEFDKL
jgi:hypothetical protein